MGKKQRTPLARRAYPALLAACLMLPAVLQAAETRVPREKVLHRLANASFEAEAYAKAVEHYKACIQSGFALSKEETLRYATSLERSGALGEAAEVLEALRKNRPDRVPLLRRLASLYDRQERFEASAALYRRLAEVTSRQPDALEGLLNALLALKRFEKARRISRQLLDAAPDDVERLARHGRICVWAQAHDEAREVFAHLLSRTPDDPHVARLAADLAAEQQDYERAVRLYRKAVARGDASRETRIRLARVLSWDQRYGQALDTYQAWIDEHPADWQARREKARVLGWARKYKQALAAYDAALRTAPDNRRLQLEREAKQAFYAQSDRIAIARYAALIAAEPENLEARFDLAQVFSRQSMWTRARPAYRRVLEIYPGHFRARQALDRVNALSRSWGLRPRYTYERRKSPSRLTDIRTHAVDLRLGHWWRDVWDLSLDAAHENHGFADHRDVDADVVRLSGRFFAHPRWDALLRVGARHCNAGVDDEWLYAARVRAWPVRAVRLEAYSRREDFYENAATVDAGLYRRTHGALAHLQPNDNWQLQVWAQRSDLADGNDREEAGGELRWKILPEPRRLSLTYRAVHDGFAEGDPAYFSPGSFWTQQIQLDWRHQLGKHELFWGSPRTYYDLGYGYGWDKSGEPGHTFRAAAHHDVNERLSLHLEGRATVGDVYDAYTGQCWLEWRF